jgi:hypothetical protein
MSKKDIESANYKYESCDDIVKKYNYSRMNEGLNIMPSGEEVYFINNPGMGLWACKHRFNYD